MKILSEEKIKFIIALMVIIISSILVYKNKINTETYSTILTFILGYYFGKIEHQAKRYRETKKLVIGQHEYIKMKNMIKRFSYMLLISGITLILEKYILFGAIITIPPILDHGFYGLILTFLGCIMLIKIKDQYWWEKYIKYIPKYNPYF